MMYRCSSWKCFLELRTPVSCLWISIANLRGKLMRVIWRIWKSHTFWCDFENWSPRCCNKMKCDNIKTLSLFPQKIAINKQIFTFVKLSISEYIWLKGQGKISSSFSFWWCSLKQFNFWVYFLVWFAIRGKLTLSQFNVSFVNSVDTECCYKAHTLCAP